MKERKENRRTVLNQIERERAFKDTPLDTSVKPLALVGHFESWDRLTALIILGRLKDGTPCPSLHCAYFCISLELVGSSLDTADKR